ncbi:MAG: hypothetical protein V3T77_02680, partial [Planctomycetota bacterium]
MAICGALSRPLVLLSLSIFMAGAAQEPPPKEELKRLSDTERAEILNHFHATKQSLTEEGELTLLYDFQMKDYNISDDWLPAMGKSKSVRWSKGYEGSAEGVDGIIIADQGQWFHKALWDKNVTIDIGYVSITAGSNALVATVYSYLRGKVSVGTHLGRQLIRLKGLRHTMKPIPKKPPQIVYSQRISFGIQLRNGLLACRRDGRSGVDSSSIKNFLKKLDVGQVGIVWKGGVSGFIPRVTI